MYKWRSEVMLCKQKENKCAIVFTLSGRKMRKEMYIIYIVDFIVQEKNDVLKNRYAYAL